MASQEQQPVPISHGEVIRALRRAPTVQAPEGFSERVRRRIQEGEQTTPTSQSPEQ